MAKLPFKFYMRNTYECGEIRELLADADTGLTPEAKENLAEGIYGAFYEVAFNVQFDNKGKITNVTIDTDLTT